MYVVEDVGPQEEQGTVEHPGSYQIQTSTGAVVEDGKYDDPICDGSPRGIRPQG